MITIVKKYVETNWVVEIIDVKHSGNVEEVLKNCWRSVEEVFDMMNKFWSWRVFGFVFQLIRSSKSFWKMSALSKENIHSLRLWNDCVKNRLWKRESSWTSSL